MWAEKGGLDFEGRAKWDAWTAVKGAPGNKAMLAFVKVCRTALCNHCCTHYGSFAATANIMLPKQRLHKQIMSECSQLLQGSLLKGMLAI